MAELVWQRRRAIVKTMPRPLAGCLLEYTFSAPFSPLLPKVSHKPPKALEGGIHVLSICSEPLFSPLTTPTPTFKHLHVPIISKVLVHCAMGVSQSVSIVCAYRMCHKRDSPPKFIRQCKTNATRASKHHWLVTNKAIVQCGGVRT